MLKLLNNQFASFDILRYKENECFTGVQYMII